MSAEVIWQVDKINYKRLALNVALQWVLGQNRPINLDFPEFRQGLRSAL